MNEATIKMFNEQLALAKILVSSSSNVCIDLAHYIADNAIGKILMIKLNEEKGYSLNQVEKFNFPTLLEKFYQEFATIKVNFDEIKQQHINGRNPFQHKLITNYLAIRKFQAELYIELFEDLMREIRILNQSDEFHLDIQIKSGNTTIHTKSEVNIQSIFDDLISLFRKLYQTKAKSSPNFARSLYDSKELQKYFGIIVRDPQQGKSLDDIEILLLDGWFKIIPNSATLSWDMGKKSNYQLLLHKGKSIPEINDVLPRFFKRLKDYVKNEFDINVEINYHKI